ncbi:hypothetical protein L218DRAFT_949352 [Marasmius fiardii PR-910]|nr:hypothetical protein L218DRAFT_949352 [Marasmius fiardii PR-910]
MFSGMCVLHPDTEQTQIYGDYERDGLTYLGDRKWVIQIDNFWCRVFPSEPNHPDTSRVKLFSEGAIGSPKVLELSGVENSTILKAAGVETVLEHPTVGENLAGRSKKQELMLEIEGVPLPLDHIHGFTNAFTNIILNQIFSVIDDILLRDPVFGQEQLDLWFKNRSGGYLYLLSLMAKPTHVSLDDLVTGLYSAATARTLAIVPPSEIFSDSELQSLLTSAKPNLQRFATEFSNGNAGLAKGIEK